MSVVNSSSVHPCLNAAGVVGAAAPRAGRRRFRATVALAKMPNQDQIRPIALGSSIEQPHQTTANHRRLHAHTVFEIHQRQLENQTPLSRPRPQ